MHFEHNAVNKGVKQHIQTKSWRKCEKTDFTMLQSNRKIYFIFAAVVVLTASILIYEVCMTYEDESYYTGSGVPVILWWTPFGTSGKIRRCGIYQCYFTNNRSFQYHRDIRSILFYGTDFHINDLPSWKSERVPWGLLHEESPRNNPILVHREALNLFNYSSTFSRLSDVPLTLVDLPGRKELLGREYFVPTKKKTELMRTKNLAPLLYIQSDCDTASDRDAYVLELMKHLHVDSYGACLNNGQLDERLKRNYLESLRSDNFLSFVANYKFTIAFENAICEDYITEKLWRPLVVGSVPIYYGSPSFRDWLPHNKSAVSITDFKDPEELAAFVNGILKNDTEYDEYLSHKLLDNYEIRNLRLLRALERRPKGVDNEFGNYVEEFECFVCQSTQESNLREGIVDERHYDCPLPKSPLTKGVARKNWWQTQWMIEKCGAKLLSSYVRTNLTIDTENFHREKMNLYESKSCSESESR